jgi:hypothetical protein
MELDYYNYYYYYYYLLGAMSVGGCSSRSNNSSICDFFCLNSFAGRHHGQVIHVTQYFILTFQGVSK